MVYTQLDLLQFVKENGETTIKEIVEHFKTTKNNARRKVYQLRKNGCVNIDYYDKMKIKVS